MANDDVKVRFAPSPTGYLHVGGARTALFNWLYARKSGGEFLLRIEDTDRERSSPQHTQIILDGLKWLGLDWDGEPVFQADGLERHRAAADRLVQNDHAYEDEGALRFRMPQDPVAWTDAVHENISFDGSEIKDFVILRSDRTPTYNFSVVCDDIEMKITHVLRGDDHISNTPKQIAIYQALGATLPTFAHVPMIHGMDGRKLSKRHGATAVGDYEGIGILPEAMRNFLVLLGWSSGDDRELYFDKEDLIAAFSLDGIQKKAAVFDPTKLEWMNGQYFSRKPVTEILPLIEDGLNEAGIHEPEISQQRIERCIDVVKERARTTHHIVKHLKLRLLPREIEFDDKAKKQIAKDVTAFRSAIESAIDGLDTLDESQWTDQTLDSLFRNLADQADVKLGKMMQPVRIAVTGTTVSESLTALLPLVGKDETLKRLRAALKASQGI